MQSTSTARRKFIVLLFTMTGLVVCQFHIVTQAIHWYSAFAQDHDAQFLLQGVTEGFSYQFTDHDSDGEFYNVANYIPVEHVEKVDACMGTIQDCSGSLHFSES
jgi:hypothetical protein